MPESPDSNPSAITPNFAHAMQSLSQQAGKIRPVMDDSAAASSNNSGGSGPKNNGLRQEILLAIGQMLKPVAMGIESVTRLAIENRQLLAKLTGSGGVTPTLALTAGQTQTFENIAQQLNRGASVESANQKLFDALHAELKGYKDGFLFDALQRPFIRDLINVYDELESQHARAKARVQETANSDPFAAAVAENLQNTLSHLLEIFERLQVVPQCTAVGEPVDKRVHRVVDLRPAARQDQSGLVLHSQRPGFLWRDGRCVRPEEVVASRWVPEGAATGGTTHLPP